jgi:hypothetical protein
MIGPALMIRICVFLIITILYNIVDIIVYVPQLGGGNKPRAVGEKTLG